MVQMTKVQIIRALDNQWMGGCSSYVVNRHWSCTFDMASVCACMKYLFVKFYHDLINWKMPKGIMKLK